MATLAQLYEIFDAYETKVKKVRSKASAFAGAFNMGDDPRRHECHEQFYEDVESWVRAFLDEGPSPEALSEAARWLLETAAKHRGEDVYWYLYAIHSHAKPLIPLLTAEDCRSLREMYDSTYPVLDRLPAQQEVYRLLKAHSGGDGPGKPGFLSFFKRKKQ